MADTLRIGFVGAGSIVRTRHIPNLQNIEGLEFVSVCNRSQESSERFAQAYGVRKVYSEWRELVRDNEIDIVWIGTWPNMHCPIALEALEAGKHVFCQARMAMNLAEAQTMRDAARKSGKATMLCPPPMGLKGDFAMRQLLDEGVLGDIYSIHFRDINGTFRDPESPIHWRQRECFSGFNTLTIGIYAEVVHRWFGYAANVTAVAKTFITHRSSSGGETVAVDRPDIVMVLSEMDNGALMRWEWSSLSSAESVNLLEAYGSRGAVIYDFRDDRIYLSENGKSWEPYPIPAGRERQWTVERDFITTVRDGGEVHPNFEDGVRYMELTEAIFRSVESGKRISLPICKAETI